MISDFKKYNRVFAFGCSYTRHLYPTYANILAQECTNAKFYNYAQPGSGNTLIAYKLAEANQRFKFNTNDLVIVMWTTFFREDRFVNGKWQCFGNVYSNNYYDDAFIRKYADPNGYMIQSCAAITLGNSFVKNLPCDNLLLTSWPLFHKEFNEVLDPEYVDDLKNTYSNLNEMPISLHEYLFPDLDPKKFTLRGAKYKEDNGNMFEDCHPNPLSGYDFLKGIGLPLTNISYNYAVEQTRILENFTSRKEIFDYYTPIFDFKEPNLMF